MYLLILSLILLNQEISSDTLTVHSEIKSVTVFQNQAQIQRVSDLVSTNGKTTIVFKNFLNQLLMKVFKLAQTAILHYYLLQFIKTTQKP